MVAFEIADPRGGTYGDIHAGKFKANRPMASTNFDAIKPIRKSMAHDPNGAAERALVLKNSSKKNGNNKKKMKDPKKPNGNKNNVLKRPVPEKAGRILKEAKQKIKELQNLQKQELFKKKALNCVSEESADRACHFAKVKIKEKKDYRGAIELYTRAIEILQNLIKDAESGTLVVVARKLEQQGGAENFDMNNMNGKNFNGMSTDALMKFIKDGKRNGFLSDGDDSDTNNSNSGNKGNRSRGRSRSDDKRKQRKKQEKLKKSKKKESFTDDNTTSEEEDNEDDDESTDDSDSDNIDSDDESLILKRKQKMLKRKEKEREKNDKRIIKKMKKLQNSMAIPDDPLYSLKYKYKNIYIKRAELWLKIGEYDNCIRDTSTVINADDTKIEDFPRAFLLKAISEKSQNKFVDASKTLLNGLDRLQSNNKELCSYFKICLESINRMKIKMNLQNDTKESRTLTQSMDMGQYCHNLLIDVNITGKELLKEEVVYDGEISKVLQDIRGLIYTTDIIMAEKAFWVQYDIVFDDIQLKGMIAETLVFYKPLFRNIFLWYCSDISNNDDSISSKKSSKSSKSSSNDNSNKISTPKEVKDHTFGTADSKMMSIKQFFKFLGENTIISQTMGWQSVFHVLCRMKSYPDRKRCGKYWSKDDKPIEFSFPYTIHTAVKKDIPKFKSIGAGRNSFTNNKAKEVKQNIPNSVVVIEKQHGIWNFDPAEETMDFDAALLKTQEHFGGGNEALIFPQFVEAVVRLLLHRYGPMIPPPQMDKDGKIIQPNDEKNKKEDASLSKKKLNVKEKSNLKGLVEDAKKSNKFKQRFKKSKAENARFYNGIEVMNVSDRLHFALKTHLLSNRHIFDSEVPQENDKKILDSLKKYVPWLHQIYRKFSIMDGDSNRMDIREFLYMIKKLNIDSMSSFAGESNDLHKLGKTVVSSMCFIGDTEIDTLKFGDFLISFYHTLASWLYNGIDDVHVRLDHIIWRIIIPKFNQLQKEKASP